MPFSVLAACLDAKSGSTREIELSQLAPGLAKVDEEDGIAHEASLAEELRPQQLPTKTFNNGASCMSYGKVFSLRRYVVS